MRHRFILFILIIQLAFVPDSFPAGVRELDLAHVNGEKLTLEYLKYVFSDRHGGHTGMLADEALLRNFVSSMIDERLLIREAYNLRIDAEIEKRADYLNLRMKLLKDDIYKSEVLDKVILTDEMVQEAYRNLEVLHHGRMIRVHSESEALEIYKKLLDGGSFEEIARTTSIDKTASNGGDLGFAAWGALDEEIERVLFSLSEHAISKPFLTKTGWIILLLEEKKKSTPPEFQKVSKSIRAIMEKRKTFELREQFYERLYAQFEVSIDDTLLKKGRFLESVSDEKKHELEKIPVVTFTGGKILLSEYAKALEPAKISALDDFDAGRELRNHLEGLIDNALLKIVIQTRELSPAGRKLLSYYKETSMLDELYAGYIMKSITISDTDIENFYKEHQGDFETPDSVKLRVISSKEREKLEAARTRIVLGEDFSAVAAEVSEDSSSAARGGDMGWMPNRMLPENVENQMSSLKPGDVTSIVESSDGFRMYKVEDKKEGGIPPIAAVREKIKLSLMRSKGSAAKNAWLSKLREAAKIKIIDRNIKKGAEILQAEFSKKVGQAPQPAENRHEEPNAGQKKGEK